MYYFVMFLLHFLILIFLILIYYFNYWSRWGAPQEYPVRMHRHFADYKTLADLYTKFKSSRSPYVGLFLYFKPAALLTNLDLIHQIFITDFRAFEERATYFNEDHDPMSAMHGPLWNRFRNKIYRILAVRDSSYFNRLLSVGAVLERRLQELSILGVEIDVMNLLSRYSMDIIMTWLYGFQCDTLNDSDKDITYYGRKFFQYPELSDQLLYFFTTYRSLGHRLRKRYISRDVSEYFSAITRIRINQSRCLDPTYLADLLLGLSDRESEEFALGRLCALEFELFTNSYDTVAKLLTFALYELAANIDIQDRARIHVKNVLSANGRNMTVNALNDMRYLDRIIHETLRKYPLVPHISRIATRDYKVPGYEKLIIHKGTIVYVSTYAIHNDPEIYPNPDEFNPDNFSATNLSRRQRTAFLGFGLGRKSCFGTEFAMIVAKIGIAVALNNFKYTLGPSTTYPRTVKHFSVCKDPLPHTYLTITEI